MTARPIRLIAVLALLSFLTACSAMPKSEKPAALPLHLTPAGYQGTITVEKGWTPIEGATWYSTPGLPVPSGVTQIPVMPPRDEDALVYRFPKGQLADALYLTTDMLLDGNRLSAFMVTFQEGENGPRCNVRWKLLNQCSARVRIPLDATNQSRWQLGREGAYLKPVVNGDRVNLKNVDRLLFTVEHKCEYPVRWCMTPVLITKDRVKPLADPVLPAGPLLDELGQSTIHEWPAKSRSPEEVTARMQQQLAGAPNQKWPESFSKWGGWLERKEKATGFFHTYNDGKRWWIVDPDGYLFFSSGMDCVTTGVASASFAGMDLALTWLPGPQTSYATAGGGMGGRGGFGGGGGGGGGRRTSINYLNMNLIRAFGAKDWNDKWGTIAIAELKRYGFNTVGNWSDTRLAQKAGVPYVLQLGGRFNRTSMVFRDFPDVFDPAFVDECANYGQGLRDVADDPSLMGYFLMNEPTWGFAENISVAEGMLFTKESCSSRNALTDYLRKKYGTDEALAKAWGMDATFAAITKGKWEAHMTLAAKADLQQFSTIMVNMLFTTISDACRQVDPNHMNLGARYHTVPPDWALRGMECFDVFGINCYGRRIPAAEFVRVSKITGCPLLVGEYHFGAMDVGMPATGLGRAANQEDRGKAFRGYLENAAACPACVGVHYFHLYDQSALGRGDGENYQIGFMDICNNSYEPLVQAARASHERLYKVAAGELAPYDEPFLFYRTVH